MIPPGTIPATVELHSLPAPPAWAQAGRLLGKLRDTVGGDLKIISGVRGHPHNDVMWVIYLVDDEIGRGSLLEDACQQALQKVRL